MEGYNTKENEASLYRFLLLAGIIFVAFNLRPSITSVGPLMGIIRDDIGLSNWSVGVLTSLPLVAFAIISPIAPKLGQRFTYERTMLLGLILLVFGIGMRSISLLVFLLIGTLFVGMGIAICNVLLPGVLKEKYPAKVALMTAVYSTAMGIFAATASGLSIPLATGMNLGWQLALLIWAIPAILGAVIWFYLAKKTPKDDNAEVTYVRVAENRMYKSPLAWQVAGYMGFQSFLFYVTISWLPEILHDYGVTMATAGWMLSFSQFIGLPASFLVPMIAGRVKSQRPIVIAMGICSITGFSGLLLGSSYAVMVISTILIGSAMSGSFALGLTFLGLRARNAKQAGELSGMAQSLGYVLAAIGPMLIGYIYDITQVWTVPLITLIGIAIMVVVFGMGAGRNKFVLD